MYFTFSFIMQKLMSFSFHAIENKTLEVFLTSCFFSVYWQRKVSASAVSDKPVDTAIFCSHIVYLGHRYDSAKRHCGMQKKFANRTAQKEQFLRLKIPISSPRSSVGSLCLTFTLNYRSAEAVGSNTVKSTQMLCLNLGVQHIPRM